MRTKERLGARSIREQCDNCRHFTGICNDANGERVPLGESRRGICRAHVNYDDVIKQGKRMIALPCFHPEPDNMPADGVWPTCDKLSFKTAAELDAEEAESNARARRFMEQMAVARPAILEHAGIGPKNAHCFPFVDEGRPDKSGALTCPVCKSGTLSYRIGGYNGHVWANCSTDGCCSWME